jgi:hypothetical protein
MSAHPLRVCRVARGYAV